jgi:hypothetical protein
LNPESTKLRRWLKWGLFIASLLTVPVPYFMVVVGGLVPLFYILYLSVYGLYIGLPKFTAEAFWMLGILWTHVVILGGILYLVATGVTWFCVHVLPRRYALVVVFGLIFALLGASTFQVYRMPGHNSAPPANIFRILRSLGS